VSTGIGHNRLQGILDWSTLTTAIIGAGAAIVNVTRMGTAWGQTLQSHHHGRLTIALGHGGAARRS